MSMVIRVCFMFVLIKNNKYHCPRHYSFLICKNGHCLLIFGFIFYLVHAIWIHWVYSLHTIICLSVIIRGVKYTYIFKKVLSWFISYVALEYFLCIHLNFKKVKNLYPNSWSNKDVLIIVLSIVSHNLRQSEHIL